jgi:multidrug efflux system membrane fusion protein
MKWSERKTIVTIILLVIGLWVLRFGKSASSGEKGGEPQKHQSVPVTTADVVQKAVPIEWRSFGAVQALSSVAIKSQISGILTDVQVKEGQDVKQGDLLFTIDPRPQEAALKQMEANLSRDTVQFKNAEKEANRQEKLLAKGLTAQDAYDQAQATAESLASVLKADEAAVATARLQLEYCRIRSPCDGRAGELGIDQGNLVKAGDATLLTINQIMPIEVDFSLPQQELPRIQDAMARSVLKVEATIPGEEKVVETGTVCFVDNEVNPQTGTIRLKGTFSNAEQRLWPGQFVRVVLTLSVQPSAMVIPTPAIQTGQNGSYVFIVKPDLTVEDRPIVVDRTLNDMTVVSDGLKVGERVVTEGQLRLTSGAKVDIKNARESGKAAAP